MANTGSGSAAVAASQKPIDLQQPVVSSTASVPGGTTPITSPPAAYTNPDGTPPSSRDDYLKKRATAYSSDTGGINGTGFDKYGIANPPATKNYTSKATDGFTEERLYTILPRSASELISGDTYKSDRGEVAYIRLLGNPTVDMSTDKSERKRAGNNSLVNEVSQLRGNGYNKFFLTDVDVQYNEKLQIHSTFGDGEVAYFFGRQPMMFSLRGLLFDSLQQDWFTKFLNLYSTYLRGTVSAKYFELVEITLPNMILKGSITGLSHQQNSNRDHTISFSLQFLAKEVRPRPIPALDTDVSQLINSLVSFTAGKAGKVGTVQSLSTSGTTNGSWGIGGFKTPNQGSAPGIIDAYVKSVNNATASVKATTANIDAYVNSMFSPVYGIISSITKVITAITGSSTALISAISSPILNILTNINNVSKQAIGIAQLVESGVQGILAIPDRLIHDIPSTLSSLKNSAGVITRVPEDISQMLKRTANGGQFKGGAAILSGGRAGRRGKANLLNSGAPYSPRTAYTI